MSGKKCGFVRASFAEKCGLLRLKATLKTAERLDQTVQIDVNDTKTMGKCRGSPGDDKKQNKHLIYSRSVSRTRNVVWCNGA